MIDTIIISGGNIQNGFASIFKKKNRKKAEERKSLLLLQIRGWNGL